MSPALRRSGLTDNNFTVLRLLLAWLVFMGHFKLLSGIPAPAFPFDYADVAVNGFFVISGILIAGSYDADASLRRFFIRRVFRLYPLYAAVLLVQIVIMVALVPVASAELGRSVIRYAIANGVFLNNLSPDLGGAMAGLPVPAINPSLWTLKIEAGFYIILPFLWMLVRRHGSWTLMVIFLLSAGYHETLLHLGLPELAKQLPGQLQYFVLGVALHRHRDALPLGSRLVWGGAILAAFAVVSLHQFLPVVTPLATAVLVYGIACRTRPLILRRDISYGVYLLHGPVVQIALLSGLYRDDAIGFAVCGLLTLGIALLAERTVERPFIALGKRLCQPTAHARRIPVRLKS